MNFSTGCTDRAAGPMPAEQQRRFVLIRLGFNDVLSQFDLFTEVITQRSEHETGVWLSGLDVLARDALRLELDGYEQVPAVCYLARGPGAAIRRARTRLPGGVPNPVAIIRVPRERMVGSGIAQLTGPRGRPPGRRAAEAGGVVAPRPRPGGEHDPAGMLADLGHLDQRDRRGLLVGREARDHLHRRPAGGRQPAGLLRLPPRPAPTRIRFRTCGSWSARPSATRSIRIRSGPRCGTPGSSSIPPTSCRPAVGPSWSGSRPAIPAFVRLLLAHRSPALHGQRLGDVWPAGNAVRPG